MPTRLSSLLPTYPIFLFLLPLDKLSQYYQPVLLSTSSTSNYCLASTNQLLQVCSKSLQFSKDSSVLPAKTSSAAALVLLAAVSSLLSGKQADGLVYATAVYAVAVYIATVYATTVYATAVYATAVYATAVICMPPLYTRKSI